MAENRKDNRNRVLRNGESQRADGRYAYKYYDALGRQCFLYSWKLTKEDKLPKGKRNDLSLREKEEEIIIAKHNGVASKGVMYNVLELVKKYTSLKTGVRHSTRVGYAYVIRILEKESFAKKRIDAVTTTMAKEWLISMQKKGRGSSTIHVIRGIVHPAFQMAFDEHLIARNPFAFPLSTVIINDSQTRTALNPEDEELFLAFMKSDKCYCKYYDVTYILLNTGLRISEFCGLLIEDIDFENMRIVVNKQLIRQNNMVYKLQDPKTKNAVRFVPMSEAVADCFKRLLNVRPIVDKEFVVDGKSGFLCLNKNGEPMVSYQFEKHIQFAREKYNRTFGTDLDITPHVFRHTFCTKMAMSGMNPKVLQYIMGHGDISVTMNTYTHVNYDNAKDEMERLLGKK